MVADGFARDELARWNVRHVVLPCAHGDGGSTPRGIGSLLADAQGYDFIAYLDADNRFEPDHVASLVELHRSTGASVCTSFRSFHSPEGVPLGITEPAEDALQHVDTSCFLVHRSAFDLLTIWARMPQVLGPLCDRVFLAGALYHRFITASSRQRSVAFCTTYQTHYDSAGLAPPPGVKPRDVLQPALTWLATRDGVEECLRRFGFWPLSSIRL